MFEALTSFLWVVLIFAIFLLVVVFIFLSKRDDKLHKFESDLNIREKQLNKRIEEYKGKEKELKSKFDAAVDRRVQELTQIDYLNYSDKEDENKQKNEEADIVSLKSLISTLKFEKSNLESERNELSQKLRQYDTIEKLLSSDHEIISYFKSLSDNTTVSYVLRDNSLTGFVNSFTIFPGRLLDIHANIKSSDGSKIYHTTLNSCTCDSYTKKSAVPCKHMYFLANYLYNFVDSYKPIYEANSQEHYRLKEEAKKYKVVSKKYDNIKNVLSNKEFDTKMISSLFRDVIINNKKLKKSMCDAYKILFNADLDLKDL